MKEEGKAQDNSAGSSKRPREERRRRNRDNKKEEAFAVTTAPANGKSGFKGKCYTCGQEGHVKADCSQKPKDGATSGRKPGAVCNFCHKRDSHTEDECWEKHPKKKPEKWRKKDGGGAKQAYAAGAEPSALEAEPAWDPYIAWGVSVQPKGGALDTFAIFTEEGPKLRATTQEQRNTTAAARATGEAARAATRAKEERGRVGGSPPGFKPKGERAPPAAEDAGPPTPAGRQRQAPEAAAASPARAIRIPPGFGEYGPNDPRYQGLTNTKQVGVRVELIDPPKTGPVTSNVVRRRGTDPVVALSTFHADVLPAEEAEAAGRAEGGTGGGPAAIPPSEDMGGEEVLDWEVKREQRRVNARNQGHEGKLDVSLVIRDKPPTPLQHICNRDPWHPRYSLPQQGAVYVRNFLTEVERSRREGRGPDSKSHATGAGILPKRSNRGQGSWSDLHKQQHHGSLCHLGREWMATYRNLPDEETGEPRFPDDERTYRLKAMQHLLADLEAHYARLPNQPDLHETWAFHERLVLHLSQRGRDDAIREFTMIHPKPDLEVEGPGCGEDPANEDLGVWQSHMAWEYGTDWVAGFLAGKRRYVEGPAPAPVSLWPIAHLRHHESDESGGKEDGRRRTTGAARTQGVPAPSGPVIAPPSIAPPVVATAVPTIPARTTAAPPTIPTTTIAPTPVATAPSTAPTTHPAAGGVSTTTTTGAQLLRERPPITEERHPKRAATEAAAMLQALQLATGGGPRGPAATVAAEGSQADQQWAQARAGSNGCGRWASNSKGKPKHKSPTRALGRLPKWHRTLWKQPTQRHGGPGRSVWRLWALSH
jgi:hypothetical protein